MLKIRVYSERTVDMNGVSTRVGEDAFPFVNDAGMFVADGVGGSAGVRVIDFYPECFNQDNLIDLLFRYLPIQNLSDVSCDELAQYIGENFSSLTDPSMRSLYRNPKTNINRLKKSGYVGSHAIGTIMTAYLLQMNERLGKLTASVWEEHIKELIRNIYYVFKNVISALGAKCANTNISGVRYFATTLSAAFFYEYSDSVEVIFINCGDSRSYVLDENGFRQAAEDQGRNGSMTSSFKISDDGIPKISFEIKRYKKPCSIICMTDGVYSVFAGKNGFHSTPMAMEGYFLNILKNSTSLEEAEQTLKSFFDVNGGIDDSNSLVMASFGVNSYKELKAMAQRRWDVFEKKYEISLLPDDFLVVDYQKKVDEYMRGIEDMLMPLLKDAYRLDSIHQYCLDKIKESAFSRYCVRVNGIKDEIINLEEKKAAIRSTLKQIAKENFSDFVDITGHGDGWRLWGKSIQERAVEAGKKYHFSFDKRKKGLFDIRSETQRLFDLVDEFYGRMQIELTDVWSVSKEEDFRALLDRMGMDAKQFALQIQELINGVLRSDKDITDSQEQWRSNNVKAMEDFLNKGGSPTPDVIVDGWLRVNNAVIDTTIPFVKITILNLVSQYKDIETEIEHKKAELEEAYEDAARNYWSDRAINDINVLVESDLYFRENPSLKSEIVEKMNQNAELSTCQNLMRKQSSIFDSYMELHLSEVSEDKKRDVEKNGWL